jgi:biotin operon repressor
VETTRLLALLLDLDRLAVAGALAVRPHSTDELTEATGRDRKVVLSVVGDLRSAGLVVSDDDGVYTLDDEAVRLAAQQAAEIEIPMDPVIGYGMTDEEQLVLARFFAGRILHEIPTQRVKRRIVLQRLVLEFDPGRRYTEFEVNEILGAFHPDWSTLRRGMIDEGLLDREPAAGGNLYWRSGGRVTDLPPA